MISRIKFNFGWNKNREALKGSQLKFFFSSISRIWINVLPFVDDAFCLWAVFVLQSNAMNCTLSQQSTLAFATALSMCITLCLPYIFYMLLIIFRVNWRWNTICIIECARKSNVQEKYLYSRATCGTVYIVQLWRANAKSTKFRQWEHEWSGREISAKINGNLFI